MWLFKVRSEIKSGGKNVRDAGHCIDWIGGGMGMRWREEMDEVPDKFGLG